MTGRALGDTEQTPIGVIERYHGAIKIEQLWRDLPADGIEMTTMVNGFRRLYNEVRPHEALDGQRPRDRFLTDSQSTPSDPTPATLPTRQTMQIP